MDNRIIQEVATYIYEHYADNLSLEYVADKFNLSRSYLSKKFKTATGFGFKEYIINVRIQNACNLLLETNKSITDIAFECGFNDSNYLEMLSGKQRGYLHISTVRMKLFKSAFIILYLISYNIFNIIVLKMDFVYKVR